MDENAILRAAIEHTRLDPTTTRVEVQALVREAAEAGLFGVCVASSRVGDARRARDGLVVGGGALALVTVVGFPNGAVPARVKVDEARLACDDGADEVDVVAPLGVFRDGEASRVVDELAAVVAACSGRVVKVILETGLLTVEERVALGGLARDAGAHILKTSTGIAGRGGATVEDVRLLAGLGAPLGVKASGGVRTRAQALELLAAGATRIGTSAGPRLLAPSDLP